MKRLHLQVFCQRFGDAERGFLDGLRQAIGEPDLRDANITHVAYETMASSNNDMGTRPLTSEIGRTTTGPMPLA